VSAVVDTRICSEGTHELLVKIFKKGPLPLKSRNISRKGIEMTNDEESKLEIPYFLVGSARLGDWYSWFGSLGCLYLFKFDI
jgi:hypothetical protein